MSCDHKIRVRLDGRDFVVEYGSDGNPLRIKERKNKKAPMLGVYETSYWVASSHELGSGSTMPKRIIEAAQNAAS